MSILLLSLGGGGGNILRSVKSLFRRDLGIAQKIDPRYADRLRRAVTTRFLDTNEFSLSDVPRDERLLVGARTTGRLGARHNPDVAREALEESRRDVEAVLAKHSVVIVIGTGGKGTGAGTMFPIAQMARAQGKLVIPIFVRPSFERHEVDKRRYDHALAVVDRFDEAKIRLIEILNDAGYSDDDPQPQAAVWERMNRPIARGLRGLLYVLSDLSQVDPSDLSMLFAGDGRLRIGFAEIDPQVSSEPTDAQIQDAAHECWQNPYYAFGRAVGTSLICIQGDWSNVVDAKIKGRLAVMAGTGAPDNLYTPLYARAAQLPRPWGLTAIFAEYTGNHSPLAIDWSFERRVLPIAVIQAATPAAASARAEAATFAHALQPSRVVETPGNRPPTTTPSAGQNRADLGTNGAALKVIPARHDDVERRDDVARMFASFWELAIAVNRGDSSALAVAADGTTSDIPIDGREVRKLLGTMWFRAVLPRLSPEWRNRILEVLVESVPIPNHVLRVDRRRVHLRDLSYDQMNDLAAKSLVPEAARADLDLLVVVGRVWGADAVARLQFVDAPDGGERFGLANLLHGFRS